jgi:hypothetical protein
MYVLIKYLLFEATKNILNSESVATSKKTFCHPDAREGYETCNIKDCKRLNAFLAQFKKGY